MRSTALYRLLGWLSPAFPIGAYSYSHGLEAAVESGAVRDRLSLQSWIAAIVIHGSGRLDADILRDAHHAAEKGDFAGLAAANRRGLAYRATAELALESAAQGEAFLVACSTAWPDALLERWARERGSSPRAAGAGAEPGRDPAEAGEGICHAAAVGAAMARAGVPLAEALIGYLQAMATNLASAGLRLGVVGQTDGQRILAALEPSVIDAAARVIDRDAADFGAATFAVDLASMAHESQYTRLFRS
jgi:urease accessory protein